MRLVMLGTGPFAVPTFRWLLDSAHELPLLVTRPAKAPAGRPAPPNPMQALAVERGLAVFEPESINAAESLAELRGARPELLVVCDYGQILSRDALSIAPLGGINLHASLLPKYRGAAPINWAIYHGETETGVTVLHMTPRLDAGPCLVQRRLALGPHDTAVEVEARLAELGVSAVQEAIELLASGAAAGQVQDQAQATRAPRLKKTDGLVDWRRPASALFNQVRALQPWPKTHTFWLRPDGPLRLILEQVSVTSANATAEPGTVLEAGGDRLLVAAGQGALRIETLQPAGKRPMSAADFLRGHSLKAGDRLGAVES